VSHRQRLAPGAAPEKENTSLLAFEGPLLLEKRMYRKIVGTMPAYRQLKY
jgi:hypothetical protein